MDEKKMRYRNIILSTSYSLFIIFFTACIEPVEPEFKLKEGLVTVEAIVSTTQGSSFVTLKESILELNRGSYSNIFINGAEVFFINTNTSEIVKLIEDKDIYIPPNDFVASVGDTWELDVKLQDGRNYKSLPEIVPESVAITDIKATYNPNIVFRESLNDYVPGHSISVGFNDPPDKRNYYYWNFRSFESRTICRTCSSSYYREGICCAEDPPPIDPPNFYRTYDCETDCWRIRYNENINILDDEFVNGSAIDQLPIAEILLFNKKDILVEVQQFSLSKSAYDYYKVLKDIIDNSGGFNAPPPAALVGNMFNPDNGEEYVLGRFTAGATFTATIFIKRDNITESVIESVLPPFPETGSGPMPCRLIEEGPVLYAPCVEGRYVTGIRHEDWPN